MIEHLKDTMDPVVESVMVLLEMVIQYGHPREAHEATYYKRLILENLQEAIGSEDDVISPMVDFGGDGVGPRLLLLGYDFFHKHHRVTPSMEANFFVPVTEAKMSLNKSF